LHQHLNKWTMELRPVRSLLLSVIDEIAELGRLVLEERKIAVSRPSDKGIGDTATRAIPAINADT